MRRKYWIIGVLVPVVLISCQIVYWRMMADRLSTGFQDWLVSRTAQGWEANSGPLSIGGWPWAATLNAPNLVLRRHPPATQDNIDLAASRVTLSLSLLNPTILRMFLAGPTHVHAGEALDVVVTGDQTSISMPVAEGDRQVLALHASMLRLEPATGAWHATAGLLNAQTEVNSAATQPAAIFSVSSEAIALPANLRWPLGANISSLSMNGRLNGPLPPPRDIVHWAQEWRDGGGSLEITHFAMGWGPLGLTCSATLALDEQLQPMGSGNGRIINYAEALDRLASGGVLTKSAATAAKAVLSLLAETPTADEPPSVDVPLTLQYRTLSMRQVPLVRLPELDWPAR